MVLISYICTLSCGSKKAWAEFGGGPKNFSDQISE